MKTASKVYTVLIFLFLYAPILVMVLFSFNSSNSTGVFSGFSIKWYKELFNNSHAFEALKNTLLLATISSVIATLIGTAAAVGLHSTKSKYLKRSVMSATNIPMMNPDIVTGISMMLLFVFVGILFHYDDKLSFTTVLIAHITFNLPYVILSVLPKFKQMDKHLPEAALDLGCTPLQAFLKVELPEIAPGILTGLIMSFTLSLDDFIISYFTTGSGFQTLPIFIFSMTKKRVTPDIYALSTLVFLCILVLLILYNISSSKQKNDIKTKKEK